MSAISDANFIAICYSALESPYGVIVHTNDPDFLRKKLITFRQKQRSKLNRSFDPLKFKTSPNDPAAELWIIHDEIETEAESEDEILPPPTINLNL